VYFNVDILFITYKSDAELEFLRRFFADNPHLQLLHLQWEFTRLLQGLVPPTVIFLKIYLSNNKDTRSVDENGEEPSQCFGQADAASGPHRPPLSAAACFQTVRALFAQCWIYGWKEFIGQFHK
jgi:hypothetical protein